MVKKIFSNVLFRCALFGIIGFACGYFVDSVVFHINSVFCGLIEGEILAILQYVFSIKRRGI